MYFIILPGVTYEESLRFFSAEVIRGISYIIFWI